MKKKFVSKKSNVKRGVFGVSPSFPRDCIYLK